MASASQDPYIELTMRPYQIYGKFGGLGSRPRHGTYNDLGSDLPRFRATYNELGSNLPLFCATKTPSTNLESALKKSNQLPIE